MTKRLMVIALLLTLAIVMLAQTNTTTAKPSTPPSTTPKAATPMAKPLPGAPLKGVPTKTPTGLEFWNLKLGTGAKAEKGDTVFVQYTGWFTNGKRFDSSLLTPEGKPIQNPKPFPFTIGGGQVIEGWEQGVAGMNVGGMRKLRIPANLAYGKRGYPGVIPPDSILIFDIQLIRIKGKK